MSDLKIHFTVKCHQCDKIIAQCRCFDKHKNITYETCLDCILKNKQREQQLGAIQQLPKCDQ
jgi:hypothetical protein